MSVDIATATLLASLAISTLAVLVSLWAVLQTRQAQQVAAYRSVHELYDKMVQLKFENPDFLITARDWDPARCAACSLWWRAIELRAARANR
jgi:hypothetical protein